jgi:hypothetical protein
MSALSDWRKILADRASRLLHEDWPRSIDELE